MLPARREHRARRLRASAVEESGEHVGRTVDGGPVAFGSTVTITVSAGLPMVTVPDVSGMKQDEAVKTLEAAGLKADATRFVGNKVRQQQPAAGDTVEQGSTVKILVTF